MIFLDSNIVVYAFFESKRILSDTERQLKQKSKRVIERIDSGESVCTTIVHLSEISNILSTCFSIENVSDLLYSFYSKSNIKIVGVSDADYLKAIAMSKELKIKINDCVALIAMQENGINKIYTADMEFKKISHVEPIL